MFTQVLMQILKFVSGLSFFIGGKSSSGLLRGAKFALLDLKKIDRKSPQNTGTRNLVHKFAPGAYIRSDRTNICLNGS